MTILITGASGFIGSHLAEYYLKRGDTVINLDNFNKFYDPVEKIANTLESVGMTPREALLKARELKTPDALERFLKENPVDGYSLIIGDIRDHHFVRRLFQAHPHIDVVVNLAAMAGVRPSLEDPLLYEQVNVQGYMNLLEECRSSGIRRFIQASSSSVYGNTREVPFREDMSVDRAISPYAATKKAAEVMGHVYFSLYNISMIQLRFFTVYGPRQRPDLAIRKFAGLLEEGKPLPFYGDGSTERDYTYIDDIIDGITKSIQYLEDLPENAEPEYHILNLGESRTISLDAMVKTIAAAMQKEPELNRQPMQPGDVVQTNADISKARELVGYRPEMEFAEGVRRFFEWREERR